MKLTNAPKFLSIPWALLLYLTPLFLIAQEKPIALNPENPHYFLYRGRPAILVSSGEHYGAVMNLDFDYRVYLDELHAKGLNLTRLFSGAYVEPQGAFNIANNSLAPASGRFICPWARSGEPGYSNGGNKFDLSHWDEQYFTRLKNFMSEAGRRNIIVELALFCPYYEDAQWRLSPMNAINNINRLGACDRKDVFTPGKNGGLLKVQEAMVRKIVDELNGYDNLIYEICNEPYMGDVSRSWQQHIAMLIHDEEKSLPGQHLISQNIANGSSRIGDPDPLVSVFNYHYATPPVAVVLNYHLNKVIGNNETGFHGRHDSTYRRIAWEFILAGGGLFNNLDYSFAAGHEKGTFKYPSRQPGGGSSALRDQLHYLKNFMERFDFLRLKPDSALMKDGLPGHVNAYALSEPGKQYAIYFSAGPLTDFRLELPPGIYSAEWLDPVTGKYRKDKPVHSQGEVTLMAPPHRYDLALRLLNAGAAAGLQDRQFWAATLFRIAYPVIQHLADETLKKDMPLEKGEGYHSDPAEVTYLEAVGRTLDGIAPWLALPDDDSPEGTMRKKLRTEALKGLTHAVDPSSPDYLNFRTGEQPIVDAAFLAQAFLRAPEALWEPLDTLTKRRFIEEFKSLRNRKAGYNNWLLFSGITEAFLLKINAGDDPVRMDYAFHKIKEWYVGDGWYSDGPGFSSDYYNSYVIHPMFVDMLKVMAEKKLVGEDEYELAVKRMARYAEFLERLISPEGTFPAFGRSITYRTAVFQALAQTALMEKLPAWIEPAQVRCALTRVMQNMFGDTRNFDANGWLLLGFDGHQPMVADSYTSTGSLYMATLGFLALGLPAGNRFWTDAPAPWTSVKAWSGAPLRKDYKVGY